MVSGFRENGRKRRLFFATKVLADAELERRKTESAKFGRLSQDLDAQDRIEAAKAKDMLAPFGKRIGDAVAHYVEYLSRSAKSAIVAELRDQYLDALRADGRGERHVADVKTRLGRFCDDGFADRLVATVETPEIDDWLRGLHLSPVSRNNFRRVCHGFFSFAIARGYCVDNAVAGTSKASTVDKEPGILTPAQFDRLLHAADESLRPALAIGGLAGLRPAELHRLTWDDVHLDEGHIEVSAKKSKTASRRLVPISDNLQAWLMSAPNRKGTVSPTNERLLTLAAREAAGIETWPSDALRHSWVTYRFALTGDAARTAAEAGHDQAVLHRHYRALATPATAQKWFAIVPGGDQAAAPVPFDQAAAAQA